MKIMNIKLLRVIYYYYYLLQEKVASGDPEHSAANLLAFFLAFFVLEIINLFLKIIIVKIPFLFTVAIFGLSFVIFLVYFNRLYKNGETNRIVKEKPKLFNSNILSIIITILFTAFAMLLYIPAI